MKSIAKLDPDEALKLLEFLKNEQILGEIRIAIEESGLEISEILVDDSRYGAACDLAEKWLARVDAEEDKQSGMRCPKCRSPNLERVDHDKLKYVIQCKDCGCLITYLSHE